MVPILTTKNVFESSYNDLKVTVWNCSYVCIKLVTFSFPSGSVVKSLPCNAVDTGSIPGPGRAHMPRGNQVHAPQLLGPWA